MDKFAVVEFVDENSIGVVPKCWLDQSESQVTTIWAFSLIIVDNSVFFNIFICNANETTTLYIASILLSNDFTMLCMKIYGYLALQRLWYSYRATTTDSTICYNLHRVTDREC